MPRRFPELVFKAALIGVSAWLLFTAASIEPDPRGYGTHEQLDMEPCGFYARTARPCPTCGMTTSFAHMVRLEVPSAVRANLAGSVLCLLVAMMPLWLLHSLATGRRASRVFDRVTPGMWIMMGLALLLFAWYLNGGLR